MSSKVFLDSSVLIEYSKNSRPELFEALLMRADFDLYFGMPVVSEYLFHYLAIKENKSPLSVKMSGQIDTVLSIGRPLDIFHPLIFLPDTGDMVGIAFEYMRKYNLLPNDALIFSLCKIHNIKCLASFDQDFEDVCSGENMLLFKQIEDLQKVV